MSLIATIPITTENRVNIYQGTHGKYYCIQDNDDDESTKLFPLYYDIHFPLDWIMDEEYYYEDEIPYSTGPSDCKYCKEYGFYNGVFIGYCTKCADKFECRRGNGLIVFNNPIGEECTTCMIEYESEVEIITRHKENSIWETYLKGVTLNEIGDTKLAEDKEIYKDLPDLIPNSNSIEEEKNEFENFNFNNFKEKDGLI